MKHSYHTNLLIKYKLGILESEIINKIPSSTLYNWRHRDFSHIIGLPDVNDSDIEIIKEFLTKKKLMQVAKALYFVFSTFRTVLNSIENSRKLFFEAKELVIHTIEKTKNILGFKRILKVFKISSQTYYYWKNKTKCISSFINLCKLKHPMQLTTKEILHIKRYLTNKDYINWSLSSVYYKMLRDKTAFMGLVTFYKYAKLLKLTRQKPQHRRKKHKLGIRAEKPLQILHADMTIFRPLDNTKVYIYFITDNFSRKILNWKASLQYSAKYTLENLREVYEKYKKQTAESNIDFMVDDGSENKAEVDGFIKTSRINKVVAQKDMIFSNSMIEAINKRIKYDFLFPAEIQNFKQTIKQLKVAVEDYNNKPYHPLHGLTPNEVFEGKLPDKAMFKNEIATAKTRRITENKTNICTGHK